MAVVSLCGGGIKSCAGTDPVRRYTDPHTSRNCAIFCNVSVRAVILRISCDYPNTTNTVYSV